MIRLDPIDEGPGNADGHPRNGEPLSTAMTSAATSTVRANLTASKRGWSGVRPCLHGGLDAYAPAPHRGPFVHVDSRGRPRETPSGGGGNFDIMKQTLRSQRWIATLLSAVLLAGTLSPALQQVCAWSNLFAAPTSTHAAAMHEAKEHPASHGHAAPHGHAPADVPAPMESAHPPSGHDAPHSHPCDGPCADGECCSMQATPVDAPDVLLTERTTSAPAPVVRSVSPRLFAPAAERGPPLRHQVDGSSLLLSARLHVWTATYRT